MRVDGRVRVGARVGENVVLDVSIYSKKLFYLW